jgi:tetratricopeptide (TPR) repeat protein
VSTAAPGAYPGNLSLPREVREKILSTFRHTLDLFQDGKLDDCLIGCDFILKMDPRFTPARQLQEKAKNPRADVDLAALRAVLVADATAPPPATPPVARTTAEVPLVPAGAPPVGSPSGGLGDLSLDSLSLDGPVSDFGAPSASGEFGLPFDRGAIPPAESMPGLSQGPLADDPELAFASQPTVEEEIAILLKQGDEVRARGDRQQAIEIWSRVFLSDINNEEAAARIEATRQEMGADSQRVASALALGTESFARGDLDSARTQFDSILALDESAPATPLPPAPPATASSAAAAAPLPPHDLSAISASEDVLAEEMDQSGPPGRRSWTAVPRPVAETPTKAAPTDTLETKRPAFALGGRLALYAGALVLLLAAGAYFLFRGPAETAPAAPAEAGPSLEHATALFREGKTEETAAELRRIPSGHPDYAKAQKLLASLSGPPAVNPPAGAAAPPPAAPVAATGVDPAALRAAAESALAEKRYIEALKNFNLAAPHFPEDPAFSQQMAAASAKVSELTPAVKLYNDGEFETAIPMLWRIYQAGRDNQDARSYLLRSYFNQGISQLQNGLYEKAQESFGEVLAIDANDEEAARHRRFAERYRSGDLDLLGQIYVRYVSPRP